jgi:serine/threonine-protein kinase RsbW
MSTDDRFDCEAAMARLPDACAFALRFCERHGLGARDALRLNLLIEELFTNAVVHGRGGDSDTPVRIELDAAATRITLVFADAAPPFDPLAWRDEGPATVPAALEDRPVGQLGIRLVARMTTHAAYERVEGWNRLRLELARQN